MEKKIPSSDLVNIAEFVSKNNYFECYSNVKKQISGTAIGTKFGPPYACIFMHKVEREFPETEIEPLVWLRYIEDIFFIWREGQNKVERFLQHLNTFHPNLKFKHEKSKASVNILDAVIKINGDKFEIDLYNKHTDCHQFLKFNSTYPIHIKKSVVYS